VQTQRQRFHSLLLDVNQRLTSVAAMTVLVQAQLSALNRALAPPLPARRQRKSKRRTHHG
jgi:hypothetical protein